ncbi:MAG: hypothetical protein ACI3W6_01030 [Clostridia bacterium]
MKWIEKYRNSAAVYLSAEIKASKAKEAKKLRDILVKGLCPIPEDRKTTRERLNDITFGTAKMLQIAPKL